jgi:hypothetical protein
MGLTFNYLKLNTIDALDLIKKYNDNLILGSFCGSVIEFLGQFLCYPTIGRGHTKDCFYKFIEEFLSKQNINYSKYKELLWEDFRNGGAHSILPKGAVVLTGDSREVKHHLQLMKDYTNNNYHLVLFTPSFVDDLKRAILDFVAKTQNDPVLANNYLETIKKHKKDGQDFIKIFMAKNNIGVDFEDKLEGDIHI